MRIIVKGELTLERLVEALSEAATRFEENRPGSRIYGANIYVEAFDSDGLPFDLIDHRGKPLVIVLNAPSGQPDFPALTPAGEARRSAKPNRNPRGERRRNFDEIELENQIKREREDKHRLACNDLEQWNAYTRIRLESDADLFVEEMNSVVQKVWGSSTPVSSYGRIKGKPVPMPVYSHLSGALFLTFEYGSPICREVANPLFSGATNNVYDSSLEPWIARKEWVEVIKGCAALVCHYDPSLSRICEEYKTDTDFKWVGEIDEHWSMKHEYDALAAVTKVLVASNPEEFATTLNSIVDGVWAAQKPTDSNPKRKGQPLWVPRYIICDGALHLSYGNWREPKKLRNPIYTGTQSMSSRDCGEFTTFWSHSAWKDAVSMIDSYLSSMRSKHGLDDPLAVERLLVNADSPARRGVSKVKEQQVKHDEPDEW